MSPFLQLEMEMARKRQAGFLSKQQKKHARQRRARHSAIAKQSQDDATLGQIAKEHKRVKAQNNALIKLQRDTKWHHSITQDGARMDSGVMALLLIPLAISASMVSAVAVQISEMKDSAFVAMGGQDERFFSQKRKQNMLPFANVNSAIMQLYLLFRQILHLTGWIHCRGVFAITGGLHQYMHQDRGFYHSLSVFVCIKARSVRFGRPGRTDLVIHMNPGDVAVFNGTVWHSGLFNAPDSCVIFMYFDKERYAVDPKELEDPQADPSRFGFKVMFNEQQWSAYSASRSDNPETLHIQELTDIKAVGVAMLHALIPKDQWTLDR